MTISAIFTRTLSRHVKSGFLMVFIGLASSSCRKQEPIVVVMSEPSVESVVVEAVISDALKENRIEGQAGLLMEWQENSPIHWQPWEPESLAHAKLSKRLVMCVIAMPHQTAMYECLSELSSSEESVQIINDHYVPILIDASSSREMSVLAAELCAEAKSRVSFPLLVWMTHRAEPVAWHPVLPKVKGGIVNVLKQAHVMIDPAWRKDLKRHDPDDPQGYIYLNSHHDNIERRKKFETSRMNLSASDDEKRDAISSIKRLVDLYDEISKSFDKTGGLYPSGTIQLLSTASTRPGIPAELRVSCKEIMAEFVPALLSSAMFDPLEGGVYTAKDGKSWDFPSYVRRCSDQAKVIKVMLSAHEAVPDAQVLKACEGLAGFAEKKFRRSDGLFVIQTGESTDPLKWMWTMEELGRVLTEEELTWWKKASQLKGLGNIPLEMDPLRKLFRRNVLSMKMRMPALAKHFEMPVGEFEEKFTASKSKLVAFRDERISISAKTQPANAEASFSMVSAYVSLFTTTGDASYLERAEKLMNASMAAFYQDGRFRVYAVDASPYHNEGRAYVYALAVQAACDLASATGDVNWVDAADMILSRMDALFAGDLFVMECSEAVELVELPFEDRIMLFGDSTLGVMSVVGQSLEGLGRKLPPKIESKVNLLPVATRGHPVAYTDWLLATIQRQYRIQVLIGEDCQADLMSAVMRLGVSKIGRRMALPIEKVAAGHVKLLWSDGQSVMVDDVASLQEVLLRLSNE